MVRATDIIDESLLILHRQSNGSIAGVWDSAQKCFGTAHLTPPSARSDPWPVSLESSSVPRTVFSPTDFSYSGDVYLSDLDLAFLQTALSKRASRFQCLQRVAYASSFAQCGYDSRMQLDMARLHFHPWRSSPFRAPMQGRWRRR